MSTVNKNTKKKRIIYLDTLRALAIISVISFHVFCRVAWVVFPDYSTIPSLNWFIVDIIGPCSRYGVDLFLMLSGALSLGRQWDIKSFLSKRIPRIVMPFVFWCVILSLVLLLIIYLYPNFLPLTEQFNLKIAFFKSFYILDIFDFIGNAMFAQSRWFTPNWFFWMILGTYLIMPIFNKWLYSADLKEAEYFLAIWLITCVFDFTLFETFPIKISYFSGPIGMVVLGYYLRHTKRKIFNDLKWSIIILLIGLISTISVSYLWSSNSTVFAFHRYSIFMAIMSVGIFTLFKNIDKLNLKVFNSPDSIFRKITFSIAKYSYGIYLIHMVFLNLIFMFVLPYVHFKVLVVTVLLGALIIPWFILAILNRVPYVNQVIGAK